MKQLQKQWLRSVSWEQVSVLNQTLCQAQQLAAQCKPSAVETARQLWEASAPKVMGLPEVLDLCRQCHDLGPFVFNNGNTFAGIARALVERLLGVLSPVEAQILNTTVSHYVASQICRKELVQVLRHFESRWSAFKETQRIQTAVRKPQVETAGLQPSS